MLNAPTPDDYRIAIPIARKHGIEVYAWLWTMNLEHDRDKILAEHPDWFSVNRNGKSLADTTAYVDYYKFLCPALPEVREFIREKIKSYCEVEGLNGIAIDYNRLVDVVLPTTLWPHYGIVQDREYAAWDYGYHPAMLEKFKSRYGYDPREQQDPSADIKWRQFRCDQITEVANMIAGVVNSYGKTMAASPFPTPKMASRMVRQDWGKWNLDIVFPMVYHTFYTEDVSFISDCTVENVRDKNDKTVLYCGMTATDGPEMFECMDAALNSGAQGIAVFTVAGLRSSEVKNRFKTYTDSVRAVRAANGGIIMGNQTDVKGTKSDNTTDSQSGHFITGLDNTTWDPANKGIVEDRAATEGQLKDIADKISDIDTAVKSSSRVFESDSGADNQVTRKNTEAMKLNGGADVNNLSDKNIGVVNNSDGSGFDIKLSKDIKDLNSIEVNNKITIGTGDNQTVIEGDTINTGSVTTGNTTINNDGLTIVNEDSSKNITINNNNVNMGGKCYQEYRRRYGSDGCH